VIANETLVARCRTRLLKFLLLNDEAEFMESSRMSFYVSEVFPKMGVFFAGVTHFLTVLVLVVGVGVGMLLTSWTLSLIGLVGLFLVGLLVLCFNKIVISEGGKLPLEQQNLLAGVQRISRNWLLVRILRTGQREYADLKVSVDKYLESVKKGTLWTYMGSESPPTFGIAILMLIVFVQLKFDVIPGGQFLPFLYLFIRFAQYVGSLAKTIGVSFTYYPNFKIGAELFGQIEKSVAVNQAGRPALSIANMLKSGVGSLPERQDLAPSVEFENVSFSYRNGPVILDEFSTIVQPGVHLGIIGESGSGKSTFLGLLLGVLKPTHGRVLVGGKSPSDYFMNSGMSVGYVGPDPFLIKGTIRDNLLYGYIGHVTDDDCWLALEAASLRTFLEGTNLKLQFEINENGDGLSAGQKQRLSLARAFLRKPRILILDEASANVDARTESEMASTISKLKGKTTCLMVSHRPGFLEFVDKTISFAAKGVAEMAPGK
jgi:ABC-type multidrug transport system fused ATPase/permease subunit